MYLDSFSTHFGDIKDSRQSAKITYPLFDILFVSLCSVIAGAEGWKDIEEYAKGHLDWFQERGFLPHGVPVDDTIARIISRIKPDQFHQCFINWMQDVHRLTQGQLVAIDGKTLRGSYNREDRQSTLHRVSAYACANKVVIGQVITEEKSNEITAIPDLIKLLDIKGALVSIDAMGCQTGIAKAIVAKQADYLLAVKGNQKSLYKAVQHAFTESLAEQEKAYQIERSHGRIEARGYYVQDASELARQFPKYKGLNTIGVVLSYRQVKGEAPSLAYRYYISSARLNEAQFAEAVRGHWEIENSLHWVLDVSMKEDECQINKDHGAENMATLRHMSLNMLRAESTKASMPTKRKRAWMKTEFLEQVLKAGLSQLNKK